ncbi:unnamed protein product [Mytilus coruscus]|uniref:DUF4371 domain-containing protein n=1 Tax=Mytilus coruscus TaxID=42192 RepID=A0A6J8EWG1_MYTCO|nr:unnamed protein product [Mytilus coruscus]
MVEKCKISGFYSVMADETTDVSVTEQLSLCIRYFKNATYEVREDILRFIELSVDTVSSPLADYLSSHPALTKIENLSTSESRTNASGHRRYFEDQDCIVAVEVAHVVLCILKPLTFVFQKLNCNMVEESKILLKLLMEKRTDEQFSELYKRSATIANAIERDLMPRTRVDRQVRR